MFFNCYECDFVAVVGSRLPFKVIAVFWAGKVSHVAWSRVLIMCGLRCSLQVRVGVCLCVTIS